MCGVEMSSHSEQNSIEHGEADNQRRMGLAAATFVGISAIVGGGIFVLGGVAIRETGSGAVLAYVLNGVIALITVLSFAEMSSAFPQSGGSYAFAKNVLSLRAQFTMGWLLWFAHIVAALLYALGFAAYGELILFRLAEEMLGGAPGWLTTSATRLVLSATAVLVYTRTLVVRASPGGNWTNIAKLVIFVLLLLAGFVALAKSDLSATIGRATDILPMGQFGLLTAMGYTFITLQGFDSIAAVAGEVRDPERTIPRAMFLALGIALVIYLPLMIVVVTVGAPPDVPIHEWCGARADTCFANAAENFLGSFGFWFVSLSALLGTATALHANLFSASRIVLTMGCDRTLPSTVGVTDLKFGTPVVAVLTNMTIVLLLLALVPDLGAAGAAASLVFLLSFAFCHGTCLVARLRGAIPEKAFRSPCFPWTQIVGLLACGFLAIFQGVVVPAAGAVLLAWIGVGLVLYYVLFASRAEAVDSFAGAIDPELHRSRGHEPFVLVPISNPAHAAARVGVAHALATPKIGRVLLVNVVSVQKDTSEAALSNAVSNANDVLRESLMASLQTAARPPEALLTVSDNPMVEIQRLVRAHRCDSLLLGFDRLADELTQGPLEQLLEGVRCDIGLFSAPSDWRIKNANRVLVPVGGQGGHDRLRAQVLGTLIRGGVTEMTMSRFVPLGASDEKINEVQRQLRIRANDETRGLAECTVEQSEDVAQSLIDMAEQYDLLVLGLTRNARRKVNFGAVTLRVVREAPCAVLLIGGR